MTTQSNTCAPQNAPLAPLQRAAVSVVLALLLLATTLAFGVTRADAASAYHVATTGADTNPGTAAQPFATLAKGLSVLRPGDELVVRGGTYVENITKLVLARGTATSPIRVSAYPGERPVLKGLLWLRGADYWTIDGLNVTWNDANISTHHMVRFVGGTGWSFVNAEVWGAKSHAAILVATASEFPGQPANWRIANNCVHDTWPSNDKNQDQLLYINTDLAAGPGLVERNLLFNATNGMAVKLGGPSATSGAAANVTVRYNTAYNTSQTTLVSWRSTNNRIERNLFAKVADKYSLVRGYQLNGVGNVAADNFGFAAKSFFLNDPGYLGVTDGGGNVFPKDPAFDRVDSCDGFHPATAEAQAYGRWAGTSAPAPTVATSPEPVVAPEVSASPSPEPTSTTSRRQRATTRISAFQLQR